MSSGQTPLFFLILSMEQGSVLPLLERSSPGTREGSQGWNSDLVSHRNLGTQAAPGLGSAIIYSCALRQSTISRKMRTREEKQRGERISKGSVGAEKP